MSEFINRAEICGVVGKLAIRNSGSVIREIDFSMVTEFRYTDKHGANQIECTWHDVHCDPALTQGMPLTITGDSRMFWVGKSVRCIGRLRNIPTLSPSGKKYYKRDILAEFIEVV